MSPDTGWKPDSWYQAQPAQREKEQVAFLDSDYMRENEERNAAIRAAMQAGKTYSQIGREFEITRERVRQIVFSRKYEGGLSRRALNVLAELASYSRDLGEMSIADLLRRQNCGIGTAIEIATYARDCGTPLKPAKSLPATSSAEQRKTLRSLACPAAREYRVQLWAYVDAVSEADAIARTRELISSQGESVGWLASASEDA